MLVYLAAVTGDIEGFGRSWWLRLDGMLVDAQMEGLHMCMHTLGHLERVSGNDSIRSERSSSPLELLISGRINIWKPYLLAVHTVAESLYQRFS